MTRLKPIHAKLYRALLQRRFPNMTAVQGSEAAVWGNACVRDTITVRWVIALERSSGSWVLTCFIGDKEIRQTRSTQLDVIDYELDDAMGAEIHAIECREAEEAEAKWEEQERARMAAFLRELVNAPDEAVLHGYLKAKKATARADEREGEWDWHPAYTGDDDPGREYYEEAAARAREREEPFRAELVSRGINLDDATIYGLLEFFNEDAPEEPRRSEYMSWW